jgi:cytochrome c5
MKFSMACVFVLSVSSIGGLASLAAQASKPAGQDKPPASSQPKEAAKTGEQVFLANCGRCHRPPMSIPQSVTGTVIMHMRTRARLSRQDEELLLRYMAP